MVGPAQGVAFRARLVRNTGGAELRVNLQEVFLGDTGNARNLVQGVTGIVGLQLLEDATGIGEGHVPFRDAAAFFFQDPGVLAVFPLFGVIPGKETVLELEIGPHDEGAVGVLEDVLLEPLVVFQDVMDHPAQKGDVRPGTQGDVVIATRRGPGARRRGNPRPHRGSRVR